MNAAATLVLSIVMTSGHEVIIATDDTWKAGAKPGDMAMATALVGLAGEELTCWDLSRDMRNALASLAIDWPQHS